MTSYREASNNAKAARLGIIEQRTVGTRSRRDRPFVVEYRLKPRDSFARSFKSMTKWSKWGAYRTQEEADQTMAAKQRKYPFYEFRMKPEAESQNQ